MTGEPSTLRANPLVKSRVKASAKASSAVPAALLNGKTASDSSGASAASFALRVWIATSPAAPTNSSASTAIAAGQRQRHRRFRIAVLALAPGGMSALPRAAACTRNARTGSAMFFTC